MIKEDCDMDCKGCELENKDLECLMTLLMKANVTLFDTKEKGDKFKKN